MTQYSTATNLIRVIRYKIKTISHLNTPHSKSMAAFIEFKFLTGFPINYAS